MANSTCNNQSPAVELEMTERAVRMRPASFYDNKSLEEQQPLNPTSSNNNVDSEEDTNRSQINFLNTTVPQNIMMHDIVGKHTPTRNSLRHSRLITLTKTGQVLVTNQPPTDLHYQKLAKVLLVCILIIGLALCIESLWLLLWTPNLRSRDNPGWTGIPVLVSSFVGILFMISIPKEYSRQKFGYWRKSLKYISITISVVATGTSILTVVFSSLHLITLSSMICAPLGKLDSTCLCQKNSTEETILDSSYHYIDLSCEEVDILNILIIITCVASGFVFIFELLYLYLHWVSRNVYEYVRVPINALNIHRANR
ncbi:unnamed protein product [Psylliodes chrysocephalus]|uniref:Sarcospan n=1 Tax=Psylliodes chrysocephalus TaxID=3402493 RepID=A0A9P0GD12_9CUCU|nr:unnamed protein product [Psylliodes chrysocephala]